MRNSSWPAEVYLELIYFPSRDPVDLIQDGLQYNCSFVYENLNFPLKIEQVKQSGAGSGWKLKCDLCTAFK